MHRTRTPDRDPQPPSAVPNRPGGADAGAQRPSVFERLAGFAHRRSKLALALWLAVLLGTLGVAGAVGDSYGEDHSLPGSESHDVQELLAEQSPEAAGDTMEIVLHHPDGVLDDGTEEQVREMLAEVRGLSGIEQVRSPYDDPGAVSEDGTIAYATVVLAGSSEELSAEEAAAVVDEAQHIAGDGLQVEVGGDAARQLAEGEGGAAEGAGILAALVILVFMFGTVLAAGLPIITALFAVGSTIGLIILFSHFFTLADYTPYTMMLVGLGVGIDYALLIFARYRGELVRSTGPELAARRAMDTAGRTVFFAGCTVIVALLGLVALGLGSLQGLALAVALTVAVTMAASLTLLPALLALFGNRFARQFRARETRRTARHRPNRGDRWRRIGGVVQRRPMAALLVSVVGLGALAYPALDMRLGFADAASDPEGTTSRAAYDLMADGFGPGANGPLVLAVDGGTTGPEAAGKTLVEEVAALDTVAATAGPFPAGDNGTVATVIVHSTHAPQDAETSELVSELRNEVVPGVAEATGAQIGVGGAQAAVEDFSSTVSERMPLFVAIVIGVSVLLLMAVFRSVLIPLKAALLNLLSIGAALGAMTLVFQQGLFGVEPGPIEAFLPVLTFAIVFGLSMDYEVFLVSRIHEEWERTGDHAVAVREGLAHTGSVITAAASVMIVVFGAFMLSDDRMLQQMGFGMAIAILVDAVVVRCLVVPATMQLMGDRAWWLPAWLGRVVPRVALERRETEAGRA